VDRPLVEAGVAKEHWGTGRFAGVYPTRDGLACFLAATAPEGMPDPVDRRTARIRERFDGMGGLIPDVLDEMETTDPEAMWHDDVYDLQMDDWTKGRVVLVGDAAPRPGRHRTGQVPAARHLCALRSRLAARGAPGPSRQVLLAGADGKLLPGLPVDGDLSRGPVQRFFTGCSKHRRIIFVTVVNSD
jgi:hypothetical protein